MKLIFGTANGRTEIDREPHGGLQVGDLVDYGGELHRVVHLYDGCDEIVLKPTDPEAGPGFDVQWWTVEKVNDF